MASDRQRPLFAFGWWARSLPPGNQDGILTQHGYTRCNDWLHEVVQIFAAMAADYGCPELPREVLAGILTLCSGHKALVNLAGSLMLKDVQTLGADALNSITSYAGWSDRYLTELKSLVQTHPVFKRMKSSLADIKISLALGLLDRLQDLNDDKQEKAELMTSRGFTSAGDKLLAAGLVVLRDESYWLGPPLLRDMLPQLLPIPNVNTASTMDVLLIDIVLASEPLV
eukprot:TRINITY_DN11745_c0_g7_i4.p1 TRINITY_DN11745_c0_g7~~TRINITY_DN11745_c0_g7_i4.p1  ORF type:complete len:227 (+),score=32.70 TRINITY_DN11745_c0_g7_i4:690-1370(+)